MRPTPTQQRPAGSEACLRVAPSCRVDGLPDGSALSTARAAQIARGLGHPARVAIVKQFVDGGEKMARDIVRASGLAQSTVSEHLRILRDAEILASRKDGPRVWYRLRRSVLRRLARTLEDLADGPSTLGTKGPIGNRRLTK